MPPGPLCQKKTETGAEFLKSQTPVGLFVDGITYQVDNTEHQLYASRTDIGKLAEAAGIARREKAHIFNLISQARFKGAVPNDQASYRAPAPEEIWLDKIFGDGEFISLINLTRLGECVKEQRLSREIPGMSSRLEKNLGKILAAGPSDFADSTRLS